MGRTCVAAHSVSQTGYNLCVINGAHFILYSKNPEADQAVLYDLLKLGSVPAEEGRLILALPPAEIATHGGAGNPTQRHAGRDLLGVILYLMCDDLRSTVKVLNTKNIRCTEMEESEFGLKTTVILPSGGEIGLYQPSHRTAIDRG